MKRTTSWTSITLGLGLLVMAGTARAELRLVETSMEVVPTASVVVLPRTYIVPTTYLAATPTYIAPTSYVSGTSVIVPTSAAYGVVPTTYTVVPTTYSYMPTTRYVTTRYRRWWPSRYVETTYVSSSSQLVPTYYVNPTANLQASSSVAMCCEASAPAPVIKVAPTPSNGQKSAENTIESRPATDGIVASEPEYKSEANKPVRDDAVGTANGSGADPIDSTVPPTRSSIAAPPAGTITRDASKPAVAPAKATPTPVPAKAATPLAPAPASPVPVPAVAAPATKAAVPDKKDATSATLVNPKTVVLPAPPVVDSVTPPAPTTPNNKEIDPAADLPLLDNPIPPLPRPEDEVTRRESLKPVLNTPALARRNILEGRIVSADNPRKGEQSVRVVLSNRAGGFVDRTTRTDANGNFALALPEGDWTIKVTMPSGRVLAVEAGNVTASGGKIFDMYGRDLKDLVIQR